MLGRDFAVAPALRNADVGNGAEGAGGAVGFVELGVVELVLAFAELGAAGDDCLVELSAVMTPSAKNFIDVFTQPTW